MLIGFDHGWGDKKRGTTHNDITPSSSTTRSPHQQRTMFMRSTCDHVHDLYYFSYKLTPRPRHLLKVLLLLLLLLDLIRLGQVEN